MSRQRGNQSIGLDNQRDLTRSHAEQQAGQETDAYSELVAARRIRAQALVAGRSVAAVAADIHKRCRPTFGTTRIRAYRLAHGIALTDVVEQVRAWYEHEGRKPPRFSETLLSAYESAQKRPGPEYLHYLCAVYRADPEDLGYPGRCLCGRSHRAPGGPGKSMAAEPAGGTASGSVPGSAPGLRLAGTDRTAIGRAGTNAALIGGAPVSGASINGSPIDGSALLRRSAEDDDEVLRRTLLELMAGSGVTLDSRFFGAADRTRRRLDDALLSGSVSATMMDQWEETTAGYGRQYMTVPPRRLLCDVLLDLGEVRRMCEQRQQIEFQDRLCRVAAHLAALTGMIMIDIGDQRLARSFFRTARIAADETGDRCLRAWVTVREALVPLYYGDPREAVSLAHASGDLAGRNPCVAKAMTPLIEARALARLAGPGRSASEQARRMIARAHATFDQLGQDQRSDTAFGYTTRQLLFHEGNALAALGAAEAERVLAEALARYPAIEHLDRSLISFDQATCKLSAGNVEEALHIGQQTISQLPADYRPEIVFQRARDLGYAAAGKAGRVPAVRMYQQVITGR